MVKKEIHVKGAILEYSGSNNIVEVINGTRLIQEDIIIMVLAVGKLYPPNITYRYTISRERIVSSVPKHNINEKNIKNRHRHHLVYRWIRRYRKCITPCGEGRRKVVLCVRIPDKHEVDEKYCARLHKRKPKESSCSVNHRKRKSKCEVVWRIVYQSACTANCGIGEGLQSREYKCFRSWPHTYRRTETVEDTFCLIEKNKPPSNVKCRGICVEPHWKYGSWSKCTATCDGGLQHRHATCVDRFEEIIPEEQCKLEPRRITQICNKESCPKWIATEWGKCSVTCGSGVKKRHVNCIISDKPVPKNACDSMEKPKITVDCNSASCPLPHWKADEWGDCSVSCGTGFKLRSVVCHSPHGVMLDESHCNELKKPNIIEACYRSQCSSTPHRTTTSFNPTTNKVDKKPTTKLSEKAATTIFPPKHGSTRKSTVNINTSRRPTTLYNVDKSPSEQDRIESTTLPSNFASWRTGSWTECSVTCGKGRRGRYVSCRDRQGNMAPETSCLHIPKPGSQEACQNKACGEWRIGDWSQCPVSCGVGKRFREVKCIISEGLEEHIRSQSHCDISTIPSVFEECKTSDCIPTDDFNSDSISTNGVGKKAHWRTGPWGGCSKTCGGGWRRRAVVCMDESGISNDCDMNTHPKETELCQNEKCPIWRHGEWNQCSEPCGGGIQFRMVVCQIPKARIVKDDTCVFKKRPKGTQQCNTHSCSTDRPNRTTQSSTPYWFKGAWTKQSMGPLQNSSSLGELLVDLESNDWHTGVSPQPPS